MTGPSPAPDVTIVVVIYGIDPTSSRALSSLATGLRLHASRFAVEVHDNSPSAVEELSIPGLDIAVHDRHPDNPGLAVPYNLALQSAAARGSEWLLLLDQDTGVTAEYIDEVVALVDSPLNVRLAAPRLVHGGTVVSPHRPLRLRPRPLGIARIHPPSSRFAVLNSGALIAVETALDVGGFPTDYPLDFLDHAMMEKLRRSGCSLLTLRSQLEHGLSVQDMGSMSPRRLASVLDAEDRFYAAMGNLADKVWLLVRRSLRAALVVTRIRRSSSRDLELGAVARAARVLAHRRRATDARTSPESGARAR